MICAEKKRQVAVHRWHGLAKHEWRESQEQSQASVSPLGKEHQ